MLVSRVRRARVRCVRAARACATRAACVKCAGDRQRAHDGRVHVCRDGGVQNVRSEIVLCDGRMGVDAGNGAFLRGVQ